MLFESFTQRLTWARLIRALFAAWAWLRRKLRRDDSDDTDEAGV